MATFKSSVKYIRSGWFEFLERALGIRPIFFILCVHISADTWYKISGIVSMWISLVGSIINWITLV